MYLTGENIMFLNLFILEIHEQQELRYVKAMLSSTDYPVLGFGQGHQQPEKK